MQERISIPEGIAFNSDGELTTNAEEALKGSVRQGYLVLGFLSILSEKSRFGDRSYSGKS